MVANVTKTSTPPTWLDARSDSKQPLAEPADQPKGTQPPENRASETQESLFAEPVSSVKRRPLLVFGLAAATVLIIIGGIAWWLYARQFESTDDAFIDGHAVQIAPKIAGYVTRLNVTDNQLVHKGDVLLEIDPRDYQVALEAAQAAEASAAGRLAQSTAQIEAADDQAEGAKADISAAEATAHNAQQDLDRNSSLARAERSASKRSTRRRRRPGQPRPNWRRSAPGPVRPSRRPGWLVRKKSLPRPV